ncbi:MAG: DUF1667 domain-containing protein [Bacillota bacterium]|jgi:CxxC motif-containing protein|nr:DUF1667 domain-containing protein [Bacillota bacterium]
MPEKRELVCINCPIGCLMEVTLDGDTINSVKGYKCKRGLEYARAECTNPVRIVTSTVKVRNGCLPVVPVKTEKPIPKRMILDCMKEINRCCVKAPVKIGDIIVENLLGTGINIVATGNIPVSDKEQTAC